MKTYAAALLAAQDAMPAVEQNAVNPHYKSSYTTLDHLLAKTLPVLRKHGLLLTQWPTALDGQPALRTRLLHAESGEYDEDTMLLAAAKAGPQEQGSCLTYAKRYAIQAVLGISTEEDDDGESGSRAPVARVGAETGDANGGGEVAGANAPPPAPAKPELSPRQKFAYKAYKKAQEEGRVSKEETEVQMKTLGAAKWSALTNKQADELAEWLDARIPF